VVFPDAALYRDFSGARLALPPIGENAEKL